MQYAWEHRLLPPGPFTTVDGLPLRIIDPGRRNINAGPDFFNAKVDIGGCQWAGNVEIHVRASDWHRHHHDGDPAYDTVILHVVGNDDARICRSNGETIPQMILPRRDDLERRYAALRDRADLDLPCAPVLAAMDAVHRRSWITALAFERLYGKEERYNALLRRMAGDHETATFITVARALGFSVNAEPFERLALSIPLNVLGKHADSPVAVEAILFGQSGLLDGPAAAGEPYAAMLMNEYRFMAHKFGLKRPQSLGWNMGRLRPANLPYRRIAALAALIAGGFRMHSRIIHAPTAEQARALFTPTLPEYWQTHYSFGGLPSGRAGMTLSRASAELMIINVAVPVIHAYASDRGDEVLAERAIDMLHSLAPERNHITDAFSRAGLAPVNAFDSQAVIQLRKEYCLRRRCLACRFGHYSLSHT